MPSDLEIAQSVRLESIDKSARALGIADEHVELHGGHVAKIVLATVGRRRPGPAASVSWSPR